MTLQIEGRADSCTETNVIKRTYDKSGRTNYLKLKIRIKSRVTGARHFPEVPQEQITELLRRAYAGDQAAIATLLRYLRAN